MPESEPGARRRHRSIHIALMLIGLAFGLSGCIQPDAPLPDAIPTVPAVATLPPAPATAIPVAQPVQTLAPVQPANLPTIAPVAALPTEPPVRVWKLSPVPVGPEQVTLMFYRDAGSGVGCVRYIFRSKVVGRCAAGNGTLACVAGTEEAADKVVYSIIGGRVLNDQITAVSIEFADGTNQNTPVTDRGFVIVRVGGVPPKTAVPIDQNGNLVGNKFTF